MLQCNRCRAQFPDGTQTCTRCGGTVLKPVQPAQPVQHGQMQGQMQGHGQVRPQRPQRPQGVRPQRPQMNQQNMQNGAVQRPQMNRPQRPNGQSMNQNQWAQGNMQQGQGFMHDDSDFFGEGFEEFNDFNNQPNAQSMQNRQPNMQMMPVQHVQQGQQVIDSQTDVKSVAKHQSSDGSSITDWLIMLVCMLIPLVNVWYMFTTLSKKSTAPDYKKNYIKAYLIYFVVMSVLSIVITALFGDSIAYWLASAV